jgi:hypothetical protein
MAGQAPAVIPGAKTWGLADDPRHVGRFHAEVEGDALDGDGSPSGSEFQMRQMILRAREARSWRTPLERRFAEQFVEGCGELWLVIACVSPHAYR